MSSATEIDWQQIHRDAMVVDMHAHPSLKVSLFNRIMTAQLQATRAFNPFSINTDFNSLKRGSVDILMSAAYAPERGILQERKYIKALKYLMPCKWEKSIWPPLF